MPDLDAIRARLDRATPGPWTVAETEGWIGIHPVCPPHGTDDAAEISGGLDDLTPADADLIAHAPTDLAALVAEIERLRAVAEAAAQVVGAYANPWASEDDRLATIDALAPALDALDAGGEGS